MNIIFRKPFILLSGLALTTATARAQTGNTEFEQQVDAYERYWEGRVKERGTGWKPFERWRWYWETRLMPDGSFPPADITLRAWNEYVSTHPNVAHRSAGAGSALWTFMGPATTPGGYNGLGRLNGIGFHPTNPNIFWVGSPGGGLWKTTNGGATWTVLTDQLPSIGVSDIAVDPTNPDVLYLATGDGERAASLMSGTGNPARGDTKSIGVLKTVDGGASWQPTGLNWGVTLTRQMRRLLINPQNPQTVFAATTDGIYRTTDGGANWTQVRTGFVVDLEYRPGDTSKVYAATYGGSTSRIYRSTDGGVTWIPTLVANGISRIELAVSAAAPNRVDAVGCYDSSKGFGGYWRSTDAGASFTQTLTGNCTNNFFGSALNGNICRGQGDYDMTLALDPTDANNIWIGGVNNWNSMDGGTTWNVRSSWYASGVAPTVHADKHATVFHPLMPGTMFDLNDGGIYQTNDNGQNWTDLSNGLGISQVYRIGVSQTTPNEVIIGMQDNGSRGLFQNYWYERTGGDGMDCMIDYSNADIQYGSYVNGRLYRTTNRWGSTTTISANIPGRPEGAWLTPMAINPITPATIYAGYKKLYKSNNRGTSWTAISPDLFADNMRLFTVAQADTNRIYASNYTGLKTTGDGGATWQVVPQIISGQRISGIVTPPANAARVYVTLSGYQSGQKVYYSADTGNTWTNISGTLPNVPANCILYENGSNNALYVGTDVGVFFRNDTMTDWMPYQNGLPNVVVTDLEASYNDGSLYAGTYGRGLWKAPLYTASPISVKNMAMQPDLVQLYPNPARDVMQISVGSAPIEKVVVQDIHGRPLREQAIHGQSKAELSVSGLPVGNYVIQVWMQDGLYYPRRFTVQQ